MERIHTGAETVMPYDDGRAKAKQVQDMFDNIAPAYDFMNRLMTLGIDRLWRKKAVSMVKRHIKKSNTVNPKILDVATGTADLVIQMARSMPNTCFTGIDLSQQMIDLGEKKVKSNALDSRIDLVRGDCLALPFLDNSYDAVTVAFGVRNFEFLADGYREMLRVLKPGGILCVIELSVPRSPIVLPFYRLYTRHIIPLAGRIASKDMSAYTYLPASIEAVPQRENMTRLIEECGFVDATYRSLTLGVCTIYTATKSL